MSGYSMSIDKFTGRNSFSLWQIKMQALLKQQGLWVALLKDKGDAAAMTSLEEKAHATILLCLADDVIIEVSSETTAAGLWGKLESLYMTKSLTNKLLLKQRLFALRMDEVSLPLSYEHYVQSFINGKDTITLEEVRSSLHSRELRHQASGTDTYNQAAGLFVSGGRGHRRDNKKFSSKGPKPDDVCNYCKEIGHWKSDCPKKKKKQSEFAAVAEGDNMSEEDIALVAAGDTHQSDAWVLDTGASCHMCPRREWFSTYEHVESDSIKMANNDACKVAGIGSIKIRTHDGKFCTLKEVRHVPSMSMNLISLSLLDSRGFKYSGGDGVLNIFKDSDVMLKGILHGTLYLLQGSTTTYREDVPRLEADKWLAAIGDEIESLEENQTWVPVTPPVRSKTTTYKLVFKVKKRLARMSF
ncbi:unnamed protein product [Microthlaspi erraticum]|uniref:CCHC-type domain-containing protein n=1 Tax=Microthlaspi erraticum TaxID=1685480 RepID=A0A6D2JB11_9BRAS|nr:unnamed protein product [Microthlaspi erraticum]